MKKQLLRQRNLGKGRRTGIEYTAPSGELGTDRAGGKQV